MGGRGSSSGASRLKDGTIIPYGTEFHTLYHSGDIKFVKYNGSKSAKTPQETMTKGRIYVTVNDEGKPKAITFYDENNKRSKQIDLVGYPHKINGEWVPPPHVHLGYNHDENGSRRINSDEQKVIERVNTLWRQFSESK